MDPDVQAPAGRYSWFRTLGPIIVGVVAWWVLHSRGRDLAGVLVLAVALAIAIMLRRRS